jgi:hypothetical protein
MPNKRVRENTKERIEELLTDFGSGVYSDKMRDVYTEKLLALFEPMGSEAEAIKAIRSFKLWYATLQGHNPDSAIKLMEIIPNNIINQMEAALSTTLKPSWTREELDKILPKVIHEKYDRYSNSQFYKDGYNQCRENCKQALLGQGEK